MRDETATETQEPQETTTMATPKKKRAAAKKKSPAKRSAKSAVKRGRKKGTKDGAGKKAQEGLRSCVLWIDAKQAATIKARAKKAGITQADYFRRALKLPTRAR